MSLASRTRSLFSVTLVSLGLAAAGCQNEQAMPPPAKEEGSPSPVSQAATIVDVAAAAGTFTTLVSALKQTGLDKTLSGTGPFTVFAPTDAAFARLPAGVLASLDANTLSTILTYHVHPGRAAAAVVAGLKEAPTVQGAPIAVSLTGGAVYLDAIAKVTSTDITADNGIIHVIDAVLLPPSVEFPGTVVDQLKSSPRFATLVDAVVKADLASTLAGGNGGAGFTVLAPTNEAFAALGIDLAAIDVSTLSNVLLRHVAGAVVPASQVVGLTEVTPLKGSPVPVSVSGGLVTLGGASKVIRTDWRSKNGIVHVIDAVLMP